MTLNEAIKFLENYNKWRRGAEIPQPDPTELGIAIDMVVCTVKIMKQYKKLTK